MNCFFQNITYKRRNKRKARTKRRVPRKSAGTGGVGGSKLNPMESGSIDAVWATNEENEERIVASDWDIESHRSPADTLALWNLKRWFMELHKEYIAEDELVPLAQAFANSQAYGCVYPPAMMERLEQLGEPIARVYQNLRNTKSVRHLVPAGKAALLELRQVPYDQHYAALISRQTANLRPIIPALRLADIFQNIVVVNSSLKDTVQWLERLGGTISIAMCPLLHKTFEVKAYADHFFITKAAGPYEQAYADCVTNLMEILKWYCYQVNFRRHLDVSEYNVERLLRPDLEEANEMIGSNNIGYRILKKLGWTGEAGLGSHQQGIVKPIVVGRHNYRRGLGSSYKWPKTPRGLQRLHAECEMDIPFYEQLMASFIQRKPYYDLIFSSEFTEAERTLLTRMAGRYRVRCETRQTVDGLSQFVLLRYPFPPHEILVQVLIYEHPLFKKFYEVIPPKLCLIAKSSNC
ncbi:uncharacterized protein LOC126575178 [Anopheles aquasalis]|uniref:uncharacterized protein LOC126575178 n=1 Tax=Anopheles aquasalis TaxID=42839 RepID=UPI00215B21BA|nr:uncharacterized protein LOC126575178 [Anopheles aquasalis]